MPAASGPDPVMPARTHRGRKLALAALCCLVCACSSEEEQPGPSTAMGGASGGSVATGGSIATGGTTGGSVATGGTTGGSIATGGSVATGGASGGSGGLAGGGGTATGGGGGESGTFTLTSPALESVPGCAVENLVPCDIFPDENVSYMERPNVSPELRWTGVPPGTQSFAIVLMDATYGQAHWALWNIPANVTTLAANVPQDTATPASPPGSRQANANFATHGGDGYFGPHIPCNVFEFQIYALSTPTFSPMDQESAVLVAIELHELKEPVVLGQAVLVGRSGDYGMTCTPP